MSENETSKKALFFVFQQEEVKTEETKSESTGESPAEVAEVTTPTEGTPASPNAVASPDSKEAKKKDKVRRCVLGLIVISIPTIFQIKYL